MVMKPEAMVKERKGRPFLNAGSQIASSGLTEHFLPRSMHFKPRSLQIRACNRGSGQPKDTSISPPKYLKSLAFKSLRSTFLFCRLLALRLIITCTFWNLNRYKQDHKMEQKPGVRAPCPSCCTTTKRRMMQ